MEVYFHVFTGCIITVFFWHLFLFFTIRDRSYLFFSFYLLSLFLYYSIFNGYFESFFDNKINPKIIKSLLGSSTNILFILFLKYSLNIKLYESRINQILTYTISAGICLITLSVIVESLIIIEVYNTVMFSLVLSILIKMSLKRIRPAQFMLISFTLFSVGNLFSIGLIFKNLHNNGVDLFIIAMGLMIIPLALADRINLLKAEKSKAQKRELEVLQENQLLIENRNVELELMVGERTKDLQKTNQDLNDTLQLLMKTQSQLVATEKMASLAQFSVKIAHEINNPLNFISSGMIFLKREIKIYTKDQLENKGNYINEKIIETFGRIDEGISRIQELVQSFLNFTKKTQELDEQLRKFDLRKIIEPTVKFIEISVDPHKINIFQVYEGESVVECFPNKLNQVFLNLITNSIKAIELSSNHERGIIEIIVVEKEKGVNVKIKDNGIGMDEETLKKVFEPFFSVDLEGHGLGLSIVEDILSLHKTKPLVQSKKNKGTVFEFVLHESIKNE